MRNYLRKSVACIGFTMTAAVTLPAAAETFYCANEDVACLIFAINDANSDTQEKSTIWLEVGGTYTLTSVDNNTDGPNGLPSITGDLTIRVKGNGTATLTRTVAVDLVDVFATAFRLLHVAATGHLTLRGLVVTRGTNFVNGAGGLFNSGGEVTIAQCTFAGNGGGGLVNNDGVVIIEDSTFSGNGSGGLVSHGRLMISDSTFDRNEGIGLATNGTLRIVRSRITNNSNALEVGGLAVEDGSVEISKTTFSGNITDGAAAMRVQHGTVVIRDSAFVRNIGANGSVSAISNVAGTVSVMNSTFAYGALIGDAIGPAAVITNLGMLSLTNTTFFENVLRRRGAIVRSGGTTILQNTILAHDADDVVDADEAGSDCAGAITSFGNNIIGDPTGCHISLQPTDRLGDPGLDLFVDDGRPGNAHFALLPISQAVDAANDSACPKRDQIGQQRKGGCDIGAIEFRQHK
jgi:hypothetical protein